jgi:predicted transposase YbfD/YdcC
MQNHQAGSIEEFFGELKDPRMDRCKRHQALDIISITLCAVLCGAEAWTEVEFFGHSKRSWLATFLELPNGIPSHDTIGRFFSLLDPKSFQKAFLRWVQRVSEVIPGQVVAVDGKCLRRSHDRRQDKAAIQMVSAWASENRMILGQVKTDKKSNEITAIPELLQTLQLKGCIVTLDAAGCQKNIASQIRHQEADYVLALKGNQGTLREEVEYFFNTAMKYHFHDIEYDYFESTDAGHGRVEVRRHWVVEAPDSLSGKAAWRDLNSIGMVESQRHVGGELTTERRYYISSLESKAEPFAKTVRAHWGIENSLHWCLDVGFREDECRVRTGYASENFAVIRHIAMNLLKQEKSCKGGIKSKRLQAGWDNAYLAKLLGV